MFLEVTQATHRSRPRVRIAQGLVAIHRHRPAPGLRASRPAVVGESARRLRVRGCRFVRRYALRRGSRPDDLCRARTGRSPRRKGWLRKRSPKPQTRIPRCTTYLIFGDQSGVSESLASALETAGHKNRHVRDRNTTSARRSAPSGPWGAIIHTCALEQANLRCPDARIAGGGPGSRSVALAQAQPPRPERFSGREQVRTRPADHHPHPRGTQRHRRRTGRPHRLRAAHRRVPRRPATSTRSLSGRSSIWIRPAPNLRSKTCSRRSSSPMAKRKSPTATAARFANRLHEANPEELPRPEDRSRR